LARTGVQENKDANALSMDERKQAFSTGQGALASGKAALQKLLSGQNIAADPLQNPKYLANVNRLQANSLDASQESANRDLEAENKRTGGLNGSSTAGTIKDLALRKMRLSDALSSQRAAGDYRSNLDYQQQQLQNILQPAGIESGYFGTAVGGQNAALNNLTQFGLASYGPWMAAIQAAGGAAAAAIPGIGAPSSGGGGMDTGHCWVAAELYGGWFEPRTVLLRSWLNEEFRRTWLGDGVMRFYLRFGERIAAIARRSRAVRWMLRPLFELALARAVRERMVDLGSMGQVMETGDPLVEERKLEPSATVPPADGEPEDPPAEPAIPAAVANPLDRLGSLPTETLATALENPEFSAAIEKAGFSKRQLLQTAKAAAFFYDIKEGLTAINDVQSFDRFMSDVMLPLSIEYGPDGQTTTLLLTHGACNVGKYIVGVASDQTDGSDDQYQDHGQHHRVLCDVLPLFV
jgi:hypothetical protein